MENDLIECYESLGVFNLLGVWAKLVGIPGDKNRLTFNLWCRV